MRIEDINKYSTEFLLVDEKFSVTDIKRYNNDIYQIFYVSPTSGVIISMLVNKDGTTYCGGRVRVTLNEHKYNKHMCDSAIEKLLTTT